MATVSQLIVSSMHLCINIGTLRRVLIKVQDLFTIIYKKMTSIILFVDYIFSPIKFYSNCFFAKIIDVSCSKVVVTVFRALGLWVNKFRHFGRLKYTLPTKSYKMDTR